MLNALKKKILIVNDGADCGHGYGPLFSMFGEVIHSVETFKFQPYTFKLVVFTGGADVAPDLYGDTSPKGMCHSNPQRDAEEKAIFEFARQRGVKMVGICRGMQFLNVMTGGKMMHDVLGHSGGNHLTQVKNEDEPFLTNSYHHQMCVPHVDTHIIGWSHVKLSTRYIGDKDEPIDYNGPEVEAIYNSQSKIVGVQWHPEATPDSGDWKKGMDWFVHIMKDFTGYAYGYFKRKYLGSNYDKITIKEATDG